MPISQIPNLLFCLPLEPIIPLTPLPLSVLPPDVQRDDADEDAQTGHRAQVAEIAFTVVWRVGGEVCPHAIRKQSGSVR